MKSLIALAALAIALPAVADPLLSFKTTSVTVSGITSSHTAIIYGVGVNPNGYDAVLYRKSAALAADSSGTAVFDTSSPVPCKTIWMAIDVTSGKFGIASPPSCVARVTTFDPRDIRAGGTGLIDTVLARTPFADLLYVMPGKGVYTLAAQDGTDSDGDTRHDGLTTISLRNAHLMSGTDGQRIFEPGGILVIVDAYRVSASAVRLDAAMLQVAP